MADRLQVQKGEEQCLPVLAQEHARVSICELRSPASWCRCPAAPPVPLGWSPTVPMPSKAVIPTPGCSSEPPEMLVRIYKIMSPAPPRRFGLCQSGLGLGIHIFVRNCAYSDASGLSVQFTHLFHRTSTLKIHKQCVCVFDYLFCITVIHLSSQHL